MQKNKFIDIKALSALLNIKTPTLYAWSAQNKIPSIKIHGLIRFDIAQIDTWLKTFQRNEPETLPTTTHKNKQDIDVIIARAKQEVYNHPGKIRLKSVQRKEKNGTV